MAGEVGGWVGKMGKTTHYKAKLGKTRQNQVEPRKTRNPRIADPLFKGPIANIYIE